MRTTTMDRCDKAKLRYSHLNSLFLGSGRRYCLFSLVVVKGTLEGNRNQSYQTAKNMFSVQAGNQFAEITLGSKENELEATKELLRVLFPFNHNLRSYLLY